MPQNHANQLPILISAHLFLVLNNNPNEKRVAVVNLIKI